MARTRRAFQAAGFLPVLTDLAHIEAVGVVDGTGLVLEATTRAPASANSRAAASPTLPKPCTAARARRWSHAPGAGPPPEVVMKTPRPVASATRLPPEGDRLAGDGAGGGLCLVHSNGCP